MSWETVHDAIERFVRAEAAPAFAASIEEVIELAAAQTPHADWARLRAIDASGEAARLREWFEASFANEPPDRPLHGILFNVCNPVLENGQATTDLDLGGTSRSASEDPDWLFTQFYEPPSYASSAFLHQLHGIAYGTRDSRQPVRGVLENNAEYPLGLAYAVLAARAVMNGRTSRDVPNAGPVVSIAAGFGEGDIAHVGELTPTGFIPNEDAPWG